MMKGSGVTSCLAAAAVCFAIVSSGCGRINTSTLDIFLPFSTPQWLTFIAKPSQCQRQDRTELLAQYSVYVNLAAVIYVV